jgi:hypothetical protein
VGALVCLFLLRITDPNPHLTPVLYILAGGLGAVLLWTTPGARRADWLVYGLALALAAGLGWGHAVGPPAVVLAATLLAIGPAWNEPELDE